jgi:transposase
MDSMDAAITLPDNISSLKTMILELLDTLKGRDRLIGQLEHRLDLLLRSKYGHKSETINPEELLPHLRDLFEQPLPEQKAESVQTEKITYERKVKGHGRNELPATLRREQKIYDLDESEKICGCCGDPLKRIGEEKTEQLNYIPSSLYVLEHIRYKYACANKDCQQTVVTADKPGYEPIEKGLAGPGLLTQVIASKYSDHCPLYRMEDIFSRHGVKIPRSTMCGWMAQSADIVSALYDVMKKRVLASKVIHTDDTPVKVQDNGLHKCRQGRLWVYLGDENNPYTVFDYTPSRSREGPDEFLNGFMGYLQADAFGGYDGIYLTKPVIEVLCNAHARRKFYDARTTDSLISHMALAYYKRLYAVEKRIKDLSPQEKYTIRQAESVKIFAEFRDWLDSITDVQALPKSPIRLAINYCVKNWDALIRYTVDGDLSIDNNAAERLMKQIAIGRRNWLFFGSDRGGRTAAILFSLTQSAKRHGLNIFAYIEDVLTRLPGQPVNKLYELLPDEWAKQQTGTK